MQCYGPITRKLDMLPLNVSRKSDGFLYFKFPIACFEDLKKSFFGSVKDYLKISNPKKEDLIDLYEIFEYKIAKFSNNLSILWREKWFL